jgi:hypothetical protein
MMSPNRPAVVPQPLRWSIGIERVQAAFSSWAIETLCLGGGSRKDA